MIIIINIILPCLLCQAKSHHLPDKYPEQIVRNKAKGIHNRTFVGKKKVQGKGLKNACTKTMTVEICWNISQLMSSHPLIMSQEFYVLCSLCFNNIFLLANSFREDDRIL